MTAIKQTFWAALAGLSFLWWAVDGTAWNSLTGFLPWRNVLVQYSGVLGISIMSLAMILAMRPALLETPLGGLDKMYRLHKWLGIAGLVVSVTHWLLAQGPKWLVALGILERRGRPPRPPLPADAVQQFFVQQRGFAEHVGEWAFYIAVALMVLALLKRFPYRRFFQTHRLLALCYLALVFHAVVLVKFDYWTTPLGPVLGLLMAAGSIGAVMALFGRHASGARVAGKIAAIEHRPELGVLAVDMQIERGWPGHAAGQFAFVTLHADEGPHPYTLASSWNGDGKIRILVKALGDYTRGLPGRLRVGDPIRIEGPYGRFDFAGAAPRQIWIGGGIGITPFLARLQELAQQPDGKSIDLFHSTADYDPAAIDHLARDAQAAKVKLHVRWDRRDGLLDVPALVETVPNWREADVWFCGPARFGQTIRAGLLALGLPAERFHQELFEMR